MVISIKVPLQMFVLTCWGFCMWYTNSFELAVCTPYHSPQQHWVALHFVQRTLISLQGLYCLLYTAANQILRHPLILGKQTKLSPETLLRWRRVVQRRFSASISISREDGVQGTLTALVSAKQYIFTDHCLLMVPLLVERPYGAKFIRCSSTASFLPSKRWAHRFKCSATWGRTPLMRRWNSYKMHCRKKVVQCTIVLIAVVKLTDYVRD